MEITFSDLKPLCCDCQWLKNTGIFLGLAELLRSGSAGHVFEGVRGLPAVLAAPTGEVPTAVCQRGGEPPRQPQPPRSSTIPPYKNGHQKNPTNPSMF